MTKLTDTMIAEAAAAVTVSPWVCRLVHGDRFGHVQALVERRAR